MKIGTVVLVVSQDESSPKLVDSFSDDHEIAALELAIKHGERDPLAVVYEFRAARIREDDEFGDYVEELLSKPGARLDIVNQGVRWFKSKIRIEKFKKCESEAVSVIAKYAYKLFKQNPVNSDFVLTGPTAKVRVKILDLSKTKMKGVAA